MLFRGGSDLDVVVPEQRDDALAPQVVIINEAMARQFWKNENPIGQRIGLAFLCDSPAAVDILFEKVKAEGFQAHKEPWDAFWGQRYAQVLDPDGNIVDLFAWLS